MEADYNDGDFIKEKMNRIWQPYGKTHLPYRKTMTALKGNPKCFM